MMWLLRIAFLALLAVNALALNVVVFTVIKASEGRVEREGIVPVTVYPPEELQPLFFAVHMLAVSNVAMTLALVAGLLLVSPDKIIPQKNLSTSRHSIREG